VFVPEDEFRRLRSEVTARPAWSRSRPVRWMAPPLTISEEETDMRIDLLEASLR
jgi:hypothetical protein